MPDAHHTQPLCRAVGLRVGTRQAGDVCGRGFARHDLWRTARLGAWRNGVAGIYRAAFDVFRALARTVCVVRERGPDARAALDGGRAVSADFEPAPDRYTL